MTKSERVRVLMPFSMSVRTRSSTFFFGIFARGEIKGTRKDACGIMQTRGERAR